MIREYSDNFDSEYDAIWECEVKSIENRGDILTTMQALFERLVQDGAEQVQLKDNEEYLVRLSTSLAVIYETLRQAMIDETLHCRERIQGLEEMNAERAGERKKSKSPASKAKAD